MNCKKQHAKETKVDNWVKMIQEQLASVAGDYSDEAPRYLSDGEDAPSEAGTLSSSTKTEGGHQLCS
jgi:Gdp/GTP exchange factor required for growth at low temperatures